MSGRAVPERWTAVRTEILALLDDKDTEAAHLYRTAIDALTAPLTRPSLMVTGHCIRELVKVLPSILGYPIIERADASRSARDLHRQWTASGISLSPEGPSEAEAVSIPVDVFVAAREVANAGAKGNRNSRELTALIVTGQTSEADTASVNRVHRSIELFRRWAHARDYTQPARPAPTLDQVLSELEIIEEALMNRLGNMADRAKSVRELLAEANRKLDEEQ